METSMEEFEGNEDGTYNIGHEIVGKHADEERLAVLRFPYVEDITVSDRQITTSSTHTLAIRKINEYRRCR